jgi:hypothetical protein
MADPSSLPTEDFFGTELHSESTLPLLNFLLKSRPEDSTKNATITFHNVTAGIGVDAPPPVLEIPKQIPDESIIEKTALLNLINVGPSGDGKKITGNPTVRLLVIFASC